MKHFRLVVRFFKHPINVLVFYRRPMSLSDMKCFTLEQLKSFLKRIKNRSNTV